MSLSSAQIAQFREQGYLAIESFWSARETAAMQAELGRLVAAGKLRNVTTMGDGQTHATDRLNLQICPIWPQSEFFRAMPFAPRVAVTVGALIGDPVLFHLDQIFLKPAGIGAGTNWHQDNAYFRIDDPLKGTAMWTAIHDATVANGTIKVIPGSHREVYEHERDGDSDHHIRCWPAESRAVPVELPAGGAVFFAYGTAHATGDNRSSGDRAGCAHHFVNAGASGQARGGFQVGKRPILSGPDASGGLAEWGVKVGGTWSARVAEALGEPERRAG